MDDIKKFMKESWVVKNLLRTRQINFVYICLKNKTALNYFREVVMHLGRVHFILAPSAKTHFYKNEWRYYLIKMENEIKLADIFESSVERFHKNLLGAKLSLSTRPDN